MECGGKEVSDLVEEAKRSLDPGRQLAHTCERRRSLMARRERGEAFALSRRDFLITTGGGLAGMAAFGLVGRAAAATRHPQRRGTLQLGSSADVRPRRAHA
jgi:hypothetical protein